MTLEEGLPRAVQEWERTTQLRRMIFSKDGRKVSPGNPHSPWGRGGGGGGGTLRAGKRGLGLGYGWFL